MSKVPDSSTGGMLRPHLRRSDMTPVVVEVTTRDGATFDDASTIGSGGVHDSRLLHSRLRYQDDDDPKIGRYCCPQHPDQRRLYRSLWNSTCPECLMEAQRNNQSSLEVRVQRLLAVDSSCADNNTSQHATGIRSCMEDDDPEEPLRKNSRAVPLVGVAMQDTTTSNKSTIAPKRGPTLVHQAPSEEGENAGTHAPPPPPSLRPQSQQRQPPQQYFVACRRTTTTSYPYSSYYERTPSCGPHHSQHQYPTYATSAAATPNLPIHLTGWSPSYGGPPVLPPTSAPSPLSTATDAFVARLHRMMVWHDTMMIELRRSVADVTKEIRSLQVDNAQLRERVAQHGDQMRQAFDAIRQEMAKTVVLAASTPAVAVSKGAVEASQPILTYPKHAATAVVLDNDDASYLSAVRLDPRWSSSLTSPTTTSASSPWFPFLSMDETDCLSLLAVEERDGDSDDSLGVIDCPYAPGSTNTTKKGIFSAEASSYAANSYVAPPEVAIDWERSEMNTNDPHPTITCSNGGRRQESVRKTIARVRLLKCNFGTTRLAVSSSPTSSSDTR